MPTALGYGDDAYIDLCRRRGYTVEVTPEEDPLHTMYKYRVIIPFTGELNGKKPTLMIVDDMETGDA